MASLPLLGVISAEAGIGVATARAAGWAAGKLAKFGKAIGKFFRKKGEAECSAEAPQGTQLPGDRSQLDHIFGDRSWHLKDTPRNRQRLLNLSDDAASGLGKDDFGNDWSARTLEDGTQLWSKSRNGVLQNGGLNETPRPFAPGTGLSGQ